MNAKRSPWFAGAFVVLVGCGDPGEYTLSGKVMLDGKPVPAGTILFEPDTGKGGFGPGGYAQIRNGTYRTETGKGLVGGPYIARVTAGDGLEPGFGRPYGGFLVPGGRELRAEIDLPKRTSTYDLELTSPPVNRSNAR